MSYWFKSILKIIARFSFQDYSKACCLLIYSQFPKHIKKNAVLFCAITWTYMICLFFSGLMNQSIDQYSLTAYSQAGASRPLPILLSHQPFLHPRLQRSPRCLQQRSFPQQQQPTGRGFRCSCSTKVWAPVTRGQLQPEQPRQTPRLPKQWLRRQRRSEQHVSNHSYTWLHRVEYCIVVVWQMNLYYRPLSGFSSALSTNFFPRAQRFHKINLTQGLLAFFPIAFICHDKQSWMKKCMRRKALGKAINAYIDIQFVKLLFPRSRMNFTLLLYLYIILCAETVKYDEPLEYCSIISFDFIIFLLSEQFGPLMVFF